MQSRILGTTMPVLEVRLEPNEAVISEAGELSWMNSAIQLTTHTQFAGGGGFWGAVKRVAGGGTLFMTEYRAFGGPGEIAFAAKMPGHIVPIEVGPGNEYLIHRHGFLCATPDIQVGVGFQQSLGAGIFGGDGFLLQRVSGAGVAWIELSGELVARDLLPGETLRVHPGHVGAFQASVNFGITRIQGIRNMLFGGDGIFLAALTGPGRVWLQTLPLPRLAHKLAEYIARQRPPGSRIRRRRRHRRIHPERNALEANAKPPARLAATSWRVLVASREFKAEGAQKYRAPSALKRRRPKTHPEGIASRVGGFVFVSLAITF